VSKVADGSLSDIQEINGHILLFPKMITISTDSLEEMNINFSTDGEQSFCFPVRVNRLVY